MKLTGYITQSQCGNTIYNKRISVCEGKKILFELPFSAKAKAQLIIKAVNAYKGKNIAR